MTKAISPNNWIYNQEKRIWEFTKWSPKGKCFDLFQILSYYFWGNVWRLAAILLQIVMVSPGTHLVKNQESQSRTIEFQFKNTSPWVWMQPHSNLQCKYGFQNSVLQFTEIKVYSCCQSQQRLKEICSFKQQRHKSHKRSILLKHLQIDQSITKNYFSSSVVFMRQFFASGTQDAEAIKSLN